MGVESITRSLSETGLELFEAGITSLDAYRGTPDPYISFLHLEGTLVTLARAVEDLEYPGLFYADAAVRREGGTVYITCSESLSCAELHVFPQLELFRVPGTRKFRDPRDVYPTLKEETVIPTPSDPERELFESAILVSREGRKLPPDWLPKLPKSVSVTFQRDLLQLILNAPRPDQGLNLLMQSGFTRAFWPELADLAAVDHAKDMHPEGGGWDHTVETLRYRKSRDLSLALGLLLHDSGKTQAESAGGNRFDRHAEIGAGIARRFLSRLGFPARTIDDSAFLVRYHMLPAAFPRLPHSRIESVVSDKRFPLLLELYRCDELSSFRGPEGYFEACAAYRDYRKNLRNPWRSADGKIISPDFC